MTLRLSLALCLAIHLVACSSNLESTVASTAPTAQESATPTESSQPAVSATGSVSQSTLPTPAVDGDFEPEYDVFLAAMAESLEGTRFAQSALDDPELFVATGLLFCERFADGDTEEDVVAEYLGELTGGDLENADDDQLALVGTILGAARAALCPSP